MRKIVIGALVLIVIGSVLWWHSQQINRTIKVGYLQIASHTPVKMLTESYTKGFSIELIPFDSGDKLMSALVTDNIDIAYELGTDVVLNALNRDSTKFKIYQISVADKTHTIDGILTRRDSVINNISDINKGANTKIGVFPGSTASALLSYYLNQVGINKDHYELIQLPPQGLISALENGGVDLVFGYEPMIAKYQDNDKFKLLVKGPMESQLDTWPGGLGIISNRLIARSQDSVDKYLTAISRIFREIQDDNASIKAFMLKDKTLRLDENAVKNLSITDHWMACDYFMNVERIKSFNAYIRILIAEQIITTQKDKVIINDITPFLYPASNKCPALKK